MGVGGVGRKASGVGKCRGNCFPHVLTAAGLTSEHELYDFNEMKFEAIEAPY
jgi:hypothetical protein